MTCEPAEIITDDRHPGWRAVLLYDEDCGQPWGDALAPALIISPRDYTRSAADVYVPDDMERIVQAWRHFADLRLFERYLRQWHGVTAITSASDRYTTVLIFDTADYRAHAGITGVADLSGEQTEWQAWLDGDVYGVVVEHDPSPGPDPDAESPGAWAPDDSCWGFFGYAYATERAREMVHDCAT